jgi:hypothetical protein
MSFSGMTPCASPPALSTASASSPIRPTFPPPYTSSMLRRASSVPSSLVAARYSGTRSRQRRRSRRVWLIASLADKESPSTASAGSVPRCPAPSPARTGQPAFAPRHLRVDRELRGGRGNRSPNPEKCRPDCKCFVSLLLWETKIRATRPPRQENSFTKIPAGPVP